jgi:hypothetical protein
MRIADFLSVVASNYDRHAGLATSTQEILRHADAHLSEHVPAALHITGSGGKGTATLTPWVGFFDPDETTSPEEGLYVVYLFAADLRTAYLMLLQGITKLDRDLGHTEARTHLASEAAAIRAAFPSDALEGLETHVDLASSGYRQLAYSSACIVAQQYPTDSLPSEQRLRKDLSRLLDLYQEAIAVKRGLAVTEARTSTEATAAQQESARHDPLAFFRPKDESDYVAHLQGRELVKSRRHERLVREYGEWILTRGFLASTSEHPKDLVLRREGREWLVEAEVLRRGNATDAVREAVGQLLTYRHFLCDKTVPPHLVGLFTEPIGEAYVTFLEEIGIGAVWKQDGRWIGSMSARAAEIAA